jgi:L-ribulokinase
MEPKYVIGLDFGTDSVRSVIIDVLDGTEIASHVSYYKRWAEGRFCDPAKNMFRQHPLDHMESMEESVKGALQKCKSEVAENVIGIGVDTTGSTPAPVDEQGRVLALRDDFTDNANAMFVLWKDHTAIKEAEQINKAAKTWGGQDFTKYAGGVYSAEWFFSKILHVLREDEKVRESAYSWVEHADWIPAVLTGTTDLQKIKRSRCAAGHKAMWHTDWSGLPSEEFLVKLDPVLAGLRQRLFADTNTSDEKAGNLTKDWAKKLGLSEDVAVSVGAFDAHMGAVGAQIKEKTFVKILGTSCCDIAIASKDIIAGKLVGGICGQVDGSVIPGSIGLEAGQSSFGDVYAWFGRVLAWPIQHLLDVSQEKKEEIIDKIVPLLDRHAAEISPQETGLLALDWLNGRRTPYADQALKGAVIGLSLGTDAPKMYRALVEATAFGAKAIIERFQQENIDFEEVVGIGGISHNSPFVMQVLADVLGMPVKVSRSKQTVALGAAMFGAVASGFYKDISEAQEKMGSGFIKTYEPDQRHTAFYAKLYAQYKKLGGTLEEQLRELG